MARQDWYVEVITCDEDPGAGTAYNTVAKATLAGYSGYTLTSFTILKPERKHLMEFFGVEDVSGTKIGKTTRRLAFEIESTPATFEQGTTFELDHIDAVADQIDGKLYNWIYIKAGTREYPSAGNAHPVNFVNWGEPLNLNAGTRRLELSVEHRYKI